MSYVKILHAFSVGRKNLLVFLQARENVRYLTFLPQ